MTKKSSLEFVVVFKPIELLVSLVTKKSPEIPLGAIQGSTDLVAWIAVLPLFFKVIF